MMPVDLTKCEPFLNEIKLESESRNINPDMVCGFIFQESAFNVWAYRHEPLSILSYTPKRFSIPLNISYDTEVFCQRTSWGLLQVMGFKLRELGYTDHLPKVLAPSLAIKWGCEAISSFTKRFNLIDAIAAYNAGSPRKTAAGNYINAAYVDGVKFYWAYVEKNRKWIW
jgi:soluble lytic murein transglycosylase-like protein